VRRLTVPASAAFVALVAAGCGGSSGRASAQIKPRRTYAYTSTTATALAFTPATRSAVPSPAAIQHAAALTATKPGFRAAVSARVTVPQLGGNPVLAVGQGHFDPSSNSGALNLAVTLPGLLSLAGPVPTQVVLVGDEVYVQVPSELASELASESWLDASISQLGLGSSLSPADILREIARDATGNVPGQRARVTLDPRTGLVRTVSLTYSTPGGDHVSVTLQFAGFGPEPASQAPPSTEVGDLSMALRQLGF
jgi:hypothetical protein